MDGQKKVSFLSEKNEFRFIHNEVLGLCNRKRSDKRQWQSRIRRDLYIGKDLNYKHLRVSLSMNGFDVYFSVEHNAICMASRFPNCPSSLD